MQGNEIEIFGEEDNSYFDKYLNEVLYFIWSYALELSRTGTTGRIKSKNFVLSLFTKISSCYGYI